MNLELISHVISILGDISSKLRYGPFHWGLEMAHKPILKLMSPKISILKSHFEIQFFANFGNYQIKYFPLLASECKTKNAC